MDRYVFRGLVLKAVTTSKQKKMIIINYIYIINSVPIKSNYTRLLDVCRGERFVYIARESVRINRKPLKNLIKNLKDSTLPDSIIVLFK